MSLVKLVILLLMEFSESTAVDGTVYAIPPISSNRTGKYFKDRQADFGRDLPDFGYLGVLFLAKPLNACAQLAPIIIQHHYDFGKFLLAEESRSQNLCSYKQQVMNAQEADYDAVIVYRRTSDDVVVTMRGEGPAIPSVYVTKKSGLALHDYLAETGFKIRLVPNAQVPLQLYLVPFAVVVGICFFFMVVFSTARFCRYRIRERRARLSPANLKKIPTKKFKKGDEYDMCAICIEEYEENDKIRILPCNHAYHCKCVDPWLTAGKKLCPVCKQSVEPDKPKKNKKKQGDSFDGASTSSVHTTTESEGEEEEEGDNERTPLLSSQQNVPSSGAIDV